MSPINPFNIDDIPVYIPGFSSSIPTVREDSSVEEVMTLTKKPAKRRNKRTIQNDEEVWCIPWTIEEEIALCKAYVEGKMKVTGRRTYNSLNGKWNTLRPKVAQFCGVYSNIVRRAMGGVGDEDYTLKTLVE
ncbi:hypothetical protein Tco_1352407 [Tanacetum coccineum]